MRDKKFLNRANMRCIALNIEIEIQIFQLKLEMFTYLFSTDNLQTQFQELYTPKEHFVTNRQYILIALHKYIHISKSSDFAVYKDIASHCKCMEED